MHKIAGFRRTTPLARAFSSTKEKIDFGFKTVDYEEKQKMVGGVFSNVAE